MNRMVTPGYKKTCLIEDCMEIVGPKGAKGLCSRHYWCRPKPLIPKTKSCECGCGKKISIKKKFLKGHWAKTNEGRLLLSETRRAEKPYDHGDGYLILNKKMEHRRIVEQVLGRLLNSNEIVHHINMVRDDNRKENLLLCTRSYHMELHRRMVALENCGNPHWRKCCVCHKWDSLVSLYHHGHTIYHKKCMSEYNKNLHRRKNG